MLEIPREREFKKIKVRLLEEVREEFGEFVEFARTEQPHATTDNVLQYVVAEFFSSSRQDVLAFRKWQEGDETVEDGQAEEGEGAEEAEGSRADECGKDDEPEPVKSEKANSVNAATNDENQKTAERRKKRRSVDDTGEMKVPAPATHTGDSKKDRLRRRIERRGGEELKGEDRK